MRIEIPPELRKELEQDGKVRTTIRRRASKPMRTAPKTESGRITASRHEAVSDPNFQQLFQSVYDAAMITDTRGDILDANTRAEEFFLSRNHDEFLKCNILDLISGADESLIATLRKNLESDRFTLIEAYCQRFDGTLFPAETSVNRLQLTGRDYLCFFVRDVTVRQKTEEMVRTVHKAIHNAGNGIAITDLDGRLGYVNPAAERLWKIPRDKLLQRRIHDLWTDDAEVQPMIRRVLKGAAWDGTLKAQRGDGQSVPLQVSAAANHDADEQLAGMVFSFVDVSDRLRAEEMARQAERQRIMLESIGSACHHLGQPATVLLTSLGIMQKHESTINAQMRLLLHQGLESAEKLRTILHRLNQINEYRTVQYLDARPDESTVGDEDRILEL